MSKKIYLSLDDLHKLYGISPAVVSAIKKKQKKRRNKKNKKINNGTMGNKPSDSTHMEGYSSALAVAAKQLQQSNINKHIKEINDNNEKVRIEHEPDNLHPNDPDIELLHQLKAGVKSGTLKITKTKTGVSVLNKSLGKKTGPTPKYSDRVEELGETSLANNTTHNMNRNNVSATGDFVNDGITGSTTKGPSSEKFVQQEELNLDTNAKTIEVDDGPEVPEAKASPLPTAEEIAAQKQDAIDAEFEAEQLKQVDAQDAQDELEARQQQEYDRYTVKTFDTMMAASKEKYPKNTTTKQAKYNYLLSIGLLSPTK